MCFWYSCNYCRYPKAIFAACESECEGHKILHLLGEEDDMCSLCKILLPEKRWLQLQEKKAKHQRREMSEARKKFKNEIAEWERQVLE